MKKQLHASRIGLAEHKRREWFAVLPAGTPFEDCLQPDYWAHWPKLRPNDLIEIVNDEGTLWALVLVLRTGHLWAQVAEVFRKDLAAPQTVAAPADEYGVTVEWAGAHHKWRVERKRGGQTEVLAHGMDKAEAEKWAADHMKTILRKAA